MKLSNSPTDTPEDRTSHELAWLRRARAEDDLLREVAGKLKRRRARRITAGGALVLAIFIGLLAFRPREPVPKTAAGAPPPVQTATVTRPAVQTLPDGSTVELKEGARIAIDFTASIRGVTLVRGEAHFQVAPNKERPFAVRAGSVEVRAVGTAFSVQLAAEAVDVLVTEGSVSVSPDATPRAERTAALVAAGRRCVVEVADPVPRVQEVSSVDAGERLAWRIPQLEFSRTPLPEIVALMNQHSSNVGGPLLEIIDAELNQIRLTGFLRADNAEGLVRLLETNFSVTTERSGKRILLRKQ